MPTETPQIDAEGLEDSALIITLREEIRRLEREVARLKAGYGKGMTVKYKIEFTPLITTIWNSVSALEFNNLKDAVGKYEELRQNPNYRLVSLYVGKVETTWTPIEASEYDYSTQPPQS